MALDHNKVPSVEDVRGGVPTCGVCGGELGLGWASGRRAVPLRGGALLGGQGQTCADRLVGRTQTGVGVPLWFRGRLLPGGGEGPRAGPVLGRVGHLLQRRFDGCVGSEVEQALHGQGGGHGAGPEVADASAAKGKRAVVAFSTLLQNSKNKPHFIFFPWWVIYVRVIRVQLLPVLPCIPLVLPFGLILIYLFFIDLDVMTLPFFLFIYVYIPCINMCNYSATPLLTALTVIIYLRKNL